MRLPLPGFAITAAFAAAGMLGWTRRVRILTGFVLLYSITVAAFFVFSRYRVQLVPALVPLAALGVQAMAAHVRDRRLPLRDVAVVAAVAAFAFHTIPPFDLRDERVQAMQLRKLADVHWIAGEPNRTIDVMNEAVEICPERCPRELDSLVDLMVARGRTTDAIARLRRLVARHPSAARAASHLARLGTAPATEGPAP